MGGREDRKDDTEIQKKYRAKWVKKANFIGITF